MLILRTLAGLASGVPRVSVSLAYGHGQFWVPDTPGPKQQSQEVGGALALTCERVRSGSSQGEEGLGQGSSPTVPSDSHTPIRQTYTHTHMDTQFHTHPPSFLGLGSHLAVLRGFSLHGAVLRAFFWWHV